MNTSFWIFAQVNWPSIQAQADIWFYINIMHIGRYQSWADEPNFHNEIPWKLNLQTTQLIIKYMLHAKSILNYIIY